MKEKYGNDIEYEKPQKGVRERILKVVNKPYKNTYTNGLNIQGEYLKKFGFELGDEVKIIVSENQINISKIINKEINEV